MPKAYGYIRVATGRQAEGEQRHPGRHREGLTMPKAYGYIRVSTGREADAGTGLEAQRQAILAYYNYALAPRGFEWGGFFEDAASATKRALESRPAGLRLITALEPSDQVLISKLDRAFRRTRDALATLARWKEQGYGAHILNLQIDINTPQGQFSLTIMAACAEMEGQMIAERVKDSVAVRRQEGRSISGKAPYGFKHGGPRGRKKLIPCPHSRKVGRLIVRMVEAKYSWRNIYLHLWSQGVRTRDGSEISEATVRRWYHGEMRLRAREAQDGESANGESTNHA